METEQRYCSRRDFLIKSLECGAALTLVGLSGCVGSNTYEYNPETSTKGRCEGDIELLLDHVLKEDFDSYNPFGYENGVHPLYLRKYSDYIYEKAKLLPPQVFLDPLLLQSLNERQLLYIGYWLGRMFEEFGDYRGKPYYFEFANLQSEAIGMYENGRLKIDLPLTENRLEECNLSDLCILFVHEALHANIGSSGEPVLLENPFFVRGIGNIAGRDGVTLYRSSEETGDLEAFEESRCIEEAIVAYLSQSLLALDYTWAQRYSHHSYIQSKWLISRIINEKWLERDDLMKARVSYSFDTFVSLIRGIAEEDLSDCDRVAVVSWFATVFNGSHFSNEAWESMLHFHGQKLSESDFSSLFEEESVDKA